VHVGVVFAAHVAEPIRYGAEIAEPHWLDWTGYEDLRDFEPWSRHLLNYYAAYCSERAFVPPRGA
jgi:hypothetical protein